MNEPTTRRAKRKQEPAQRRRRRRAINSKQRLDVGGLPGNGTEFVYAWAHTNDQAMMQDMYDNDYNFVEAQEIPDAMGVDLPIQQPQSKGRTSYVERHVGQAREPNTTALLMRKPKEYFDKDYASEQQAVLEREEQLQQRGGSMQEGGAPDVHDPSLLREYGSVKVERHKSADSDENSGE